MFEQAHKWAEAKIIYEIPQDLNTKLVYSDKDGRLKKDVIDSDN